MSDVGCRISDLRYQTEIWDASCSNTQQDAIVSVTLGPTKPRCSRRVDCTRYFAQHILCVRNETAIVTSAADFLIGSGFGRLNERLCGHPINQRNDDGGNPSNRNSKKLLARTEKEVRFIRCAANRKRSRKTSCRQSPAPFFAASMCQAQMRPLSWGRRTDRVQSKGGGLFPATPGRRVHPRSFTRVRLAK
jgi:hypothetical protein